MTRSERAINWNRDHLERRKEICRLWYAKHKAAAKKTQKEYRLRYPEKARTRKKRWLALHPEYKIWQGMKTRCNNKKCQIWPYYGGRGIQVLYTSWHEIIKDIGYKPGPKYSIDRINNEGNYEPGNCRWATAKEQRQNQRPRCA